MDHAPQKSQPKAQESRRPSRGREALVLITVPLVAVAVTLGLFLQLGQPFALSMAMGGLVGGLLIALHAIGRRDQMIKALRDELARHNASRAIQAAAAGQPRPGGRPEAPAASAQQAPQMTKAPSHAAPDRTSTERGAPPPEPRPAEMARAGESTVPVSMPFPQSVQLPPTGAPRAQQISVPPPLPPLALQAAAGAAAAHPMAVAPPPLPPPMTKPDSIGAGPSTDPLMGSYWDLRPGAIREPRLPGADVAEAEALRTTPVPVMTMKPLPSRPASGTETRGNPANSSEQELEVMHTLIEQLAIQLNDPTRSPSTAAAAQPGARPEAGPPMPALTPPSATPAAAQASDKVEQSIEASLSALKATAETMRRPPAFSEPAASPSSGESVSTSASPSASQPAFETEARSDRGKTASSSSYSRLAELTEAVAAERIEVFLDPIHGLDDRKARHFEVAIRLRSAADESLSADDYLAVATGTGLLAKIDQAKLTRTARVADRLHARGATASLFSGVSGESLTDDGFLDTFEAILGEQDALPSRLILTFAQSDVRAFTDAHLDTMLTMAEIGVRFALDHVTDLDMDFAELKAQGFDYVKLDAPVFLEGLPAANGPIPSADICRHLTNQGLALIVGHIEDEMTMAKILGFGVVFGQGTLFGGARPVKVDVAPAPNVAAA